MSDLLSRKEIVEYLRKENYEAEIVDIIDNFPPVGVLNEIAAERRCQIDRGYDASHDDMHADRSIARAAAAYALAAQGKSQDGALIYPWDISSFHHASTRDSLIKAAALCVAEIERLDRVT